VGIHADLVADGLRIRGFAGLPDGSAWVIDELVSGDEAHPEAAGAELARRMSAAGAADILRDAERMSRAGRAAS
jgi:porphobilinogen deaminase